MTFEVLHDHHCATRCGLRDPKTGIGCENDEVCDVDFEEWHECRFCARQRPAFDERVCDESTIPAWLFEAR